MGWTELKYRFPGDAPTLQQLRASLLQSTELPESVVVASPDGTQSETLRLYDPANGQQLFTVSRDPDAAVIAVEFSPFQGGLAHDYIFRALNTELTRRNALEHGLDSADAHPLRPLQPSWLDRPWPKLSTSRKLISRATGIILITLILIASPFFVLWGVVRDASRSPSKSKGSGDGGGGHQPTAEEWDFSDGEAPARDSVGATDAQPTLTRAAEALSFQEHLSRLFEFVRSIPGCPTWSRVLVAENLGDDDNLELLQSPVDYANRFSELLAYRPWVNLHAAGLWRQALIVSVVAARDARSRPTPASVQLSGPEARIAALPDWNLELRRKA